LIRFRLAELIADRSFREGRRLEIGEIADATGIHRSTLSRILNVKGTNVTSANMNLLCAFFGCALSDLAEYVPDEDSSAQGSRRAAERPTPLRTGRTRSRVGKG
jgi:putative transcriptional regulator